MNFLIFSLGEKGFNIIKSIHTQFPNHMFVCVIGKDKGIENDFSSELEKFCQSQSIPYSFRGDTYPNDFNYALAIGWRWIINGIHQEKLIVFHDSLLPRYRGFAPLVNALLNREKQVGVTALYGAADYDCGAIIDQLSMFVRYPTSIQYEISKITRLYVDLAISVVNKAVNGEIRGNAQDEDLASYSLWRDEDDYKINWNLSAEDIEHFVNCVGKPYRGAICYINGTLVRIHRCKAMPDLTIENRAVGKVIFLRNGLPTVVCGSGTLLVEDIKNEDGKSILPLKSIRTRFL